MWRKILIFVLVFGLLNLSEVTANAAEPPMIVIIVQDAPDDLQLEMSSEEGSFQVTRIEGFQTLYFKVHAEQSISGIPIELKFTSSAGSYDLTIKDALSSYDNLFTLDYTKRLMTPGRPLLRTVLLVTSRVFLTLTIEGAIFFLFGYRRKKSYQIFLMTNLVTQGFLYVWLTSMKPFHSYMILNLVFGELLIFFIESFVMTACITEKKSWRTLIYVWVANAASLYFGAYLLERLPV